MHLLDPITETVQDHSADDRLIGVERIAGAAVIGIARVLVENVISAVVQATRLQEKVLFRGENSGLRFLVSRCANVFVVDEIKGEKNYDCARSRRIRNAA